MSTKYVICPSKCLHCGDCIAFCPENAIRLEKQSIVVEETRCTGCGLCERRCFGQAIYRMETNNIH